MNKQSVSSDRKNMQRKVEESIKTAAATKKVREKPVGRAVPLPRSVDKNSSPAPYNARNGDVKKSTTPPAPSSRPLSSSKPTTPWQRPKVTPASAVYGSKNDNSSSRPQSAASRRSNSGQPATGGPTKENSSVSNAPGVKPSQLKNRQRAVSSVSNNKALSPPASSNSRNRSTSSPSTKDAKPEKPVAKVTASTPVAYKVKDTGVVLPKIQKTNATIEAKKEVASEKTKDENLLVPPKRSRAHVMPVSKTVKPAKKGHDFADHELTDWVNWCDACGSIILSLFGKCVKCKKCMMVCHGKCALTVSLTCEADEVRANPSVDPSWYKTIVEETKDQETLKEYNTIQRVMPQGELKERIDNFNKTVKSTQQMTLQEDGETFRGFIRVTMNLTRPVSVGSDEKEKERKKVQRNDSFYVNKGAIKALYLSSGTTAEEVIGALLQKYGIKDNPLKFALFEKQVREEGHIILRKMMARERPLFLRLLWGDGNSQQHAFILQENETREIQWETFSLAELYTFLKILEKEQNDHIACIKTKYDCKRQDLVNAMDYQKKKKKKGAAK